MRMSGQQLLSFRRQRGWSQTEFGTVMALSRYRVDKLEKMVFIPKAIELACAAVALGVVEYDGEGPVAAGHTLLFPAPIERKTEQHKPALRDERKAKGGHARAAALSPERRAEIARAAAAKRWQVAS